MMRYVYYAIVCFCVLGLSYVMAVNPSGSIPKKSECVINLKQNTNNCTQISQITLLQAQTDNQAVMKISLDPKQTSHKKIKLKAVYDADPKWWTIDVCDSSSCDGYGGDGWDTSNSSELEVVGDSFHVYTNVLKWYDELATRKDPINGLNIIGLKKVVKKWQTISLDIADQMIGYRFLNYDSVLRSPYLFTLSGQKPTYGNIDYDVYLSFNRVINWDPSRKWSGLAYVLVTLE